MSDVIPLARTSTGKLTGPQRRKIVLMLANARLNSVYKHVIQHWLPSVYPVTSGSPIDIALVSANTIRAIY